MAIVVGSRRANSSQRLPGAIGTNATDYSKPTQRVRVVMKKKKSSIGAFECGGDGYGVDVRSAGFGVTACMITPNPAIRWTNLDLNADPDGPNTGNDPARDIDAVVDRTDNTEVDLHGYKTTDIASSGAANFGVPKLGGGFTTNLLDAAHCVSWLGPNQPRLNQQVNFPPYDSSVCPQGSDAPELCDPNSHAATRKGLRGRLARSTTPGPSTGGSAGAAEQPPESAQEQPKGTSENAVTNLLDRYDELLAVALADDRRLRNVLAGQGKVILGMDGLQPDVGHEVLWVIRDCLSGEILPAKSLLSARQQDLAGLLSAVKAACPVPVAGVVSDGQHSIRKAVRRVFPDVPYQLCQFHFLREAAKPMYEADRHAKKELKKRAISRGVAVFTSPRTSSSCSSNRARSAITFGRTPASSPTLTMLT